MEIKFTGLRDGEKLYEEVLNDKEVTLPTFHKKIKIAKVREYDYADVCKELDELSSIALSFDDMKIVGKMKQVVPEYKSQHLTQDNVQFNGTLNVGYDLSYTYSSEERKKFQLLCSQIKQIGKMVLSFIAGPKLQELHTI